MASWFGRTLQATENQWSNIRCFTYKNRTIFEVFFIFLYTIEQAALILLVHVFKEYLTLIISLFALIVLTTFSFHKLVMESRIKILEDDLTGLYFEKQRIENEAKIVMKSQEALISSYEGLVAGESKRFKYAKGRKNTKKRVKK